MWGSLQPARSDEPRCPDVPKLTRWSRTDTSRRSTSQAATRGGRSTSAAAGGGWPANGMNSPASRVDLQNSGVAG
jgi:hypothetical protein